MTDIGWSFDLSDEPHVDPFGGVHRTRHHIGQCAECGRAFEWLEPSSFFGDIMGICVPPTRSEMRRRRAEWRRAVNEARGRFDRLLAERGSCLGRGEHSGARLPDHTGCWYPGDDPRCPTFPDLVPGGLVSILGSMKPKWSASNAVMPMGWYDDPLDVAPKRWFSGIEFTRWVSDGTSVSTSGGTRDRRVLSPSEFDGMIDRFLGEPNRT